MQTDPKKYAFWNTLLRAVETEPTETRPLRGASGLQHPVIAIGTDANRKRLVVISGDPDGRSAALAHADIQAAYPDTRVVLARPIAIHLARIAEAIVSMLGKPTLTPEDLKELPQEGSPQRKLFEAKLQLLTGVGFAPAFRAYSFASLSLVSVIQEAVLQLSHLQFEFPVGIDGVQGAPTIQFGPLVALDPSQVDRQSGVCFIPLYQLSDADAEIFHAGADIEAAREILKAHHVFQYFFPAPDQLALGLFESPALLSAVVADTVEKAPSLGHPFGAFELLSGGTPLVDLVDALKDRGLCAEGEIGIELTEKGKNVRAAVRFKPREGLLSKLSNVFSLKVDLSLKDIFKP
jgi:hypothetical protein